MQHVNSTSSGTPTECDTKSHDDIRSSDCTYGLQLRIVCPLPANSNELFDVGTRLAIQFFYKSGSPAKVSAGALGQTLMG